MDRSATAGLVLLVLLAAGCGGGARAPRFQAATGWHLLVEPGQTASAANVPFARGDRSQSLPARTIGRLPSRGVLIWIEWVRPGRSSGDASLYPHRSLPLRVAEARPSGLKGARCSSGCFISHLSAKESDVDADIWIVFGTDRPLPEDIGAADAELARLGFPSSSSTSATPQPAKCPSPTSTDTSYYDSSVRPASGPAGSTVVVSGRLPVLSESGEDTGQTSTEVTAYWNLDVDHWPSIETASPVGAVAGSRVRFVGLQNIAGRCAYHVRITVPSAAPGRYPIDVLYGNAHGSASLGPASFGVTRG